MTCWFYSDTENTRGDQST